MSMNNKENVLVLPVWIGKCLKIGSIIGLIVGLLVGILLSSSNM